MEDSTSTPSATATNSCMRRLIEAYKWTRREKPRPSDMRAPISKRKGELDWRVLRSRTAEVNRRGLCAVALAALEVDLRTIKNQSHRRLGFSVAACSCRAHLSPQLFHRWAIHLRTYRNSSNEANHIMKGECRGLYHSYQLDPPQAKRVGSRDHFITSLVLWSSPLLRI